MLGSPGATPARKVGDLPRSNRVRLAPLGDRAVAAAPTPDEDNLVRAYAPILQLRAQEDPTDPCDTTEEQYNPPTWVDVVLGNPG